MKMRLSILFFLSIITLSTTTGNAFDTDFYSPLYGGFQMATSYDGEKHVLNVSYVSTAAFIGTPDDIFDTSKEVVEYLGKIRKLKERGHKGVEKIYEYQYTFANEGDIPIRLLLVGNGVVMSPLTDMQGDFAFTLQPKEKRTLEFWANGHPVGRNVMAYGAIWDDKTKQWHASVGAGIGLYITPRAVIHLPRLIKSESVQ